MPELRPASGSGPGGKRTGRQEKRSIYSGPEKKLTEMIDKDGQKVV